MVHSAAATLRDIGFLRDFSLVVFDELHCMHHEEELFMIMIPHTIRMVFLSSKLSNGLDFATWISCICNEPCHLVYTTSRTRPLLQYVSPDGSDLHLVVDENEEFLLDNLLEEGMHFVAFDMQAIVQTIHEENLGPVIFFSFCITECQQHACSLATFDLNNQDEKDLVNHSFEQAISTLSEEERNLSTIRLMRSLLPRGIAFYHSGLAPTVKEVVQQLFQQGLVKPLFTTEPFSTGLYAKTVVFTSVRKGDRYLGSGEYIQMSGRAGRPGEDEHGICIVMIDEQIEMNALREMMLGESEPLEVDFMLSYSSMLQLMRSSLSPGSVLNHSFNQYGFIERNLANWRNLGEAHKKDVEELSQKQREELQRQIQQLTKIRDDLLDRHDKEISMLYLQLKDLDTHEYVVRGIVQAKGNAASRIDIGDELLIIEAMFDVIFTGLDRHQLAAVASCFIPGQTSQVTSNIADELAKPLIKLQLCAIKLEMEEGWGVHRKSLMDVTYYWSAGSTFSHVLTLTDMDPGSVIRHIRRVIVLLRQIRHAARVVGREDLYQMCEKAGETLSRGIVVANHPYFGY